jgi:hypothetical protein
MSDLICRNTMTRCNTPGMCSPHGGCKPEKTEWQAGYDEGRRMGTKHMYAEVDRIKAENAGLQTGYKAYEQVNAELMAENDRLHKVAAELREWTSCDHLHHEPHEQHADDVFCKVLERIDVVLGKGGKSNG